MASLRDGVATTDTIALGDGAAQGVAIVRERIDLVISDDDELKRVRIPASGAAGTPAWSPPIELPDRRRIVEVFRATIVNHRAAPIDVVMPEHAYRGSQWRLAFTTAPAELAGTQQFTLRAHAPANGRARVDWTLVYLWSSQP